MQAYFARHGQTCYNLEQRCNDNPERPVFLTREGRSQAQGLAEALGMVPLHARLRDGETLLEHRQRVLGFLDLLRQRRNAHTAVRKL